MKITSSQSPTPQEPENNTANEKNRQQHLPFYEDDLVARVHAAKAAAQREMESFGDVSEYEIRKIYGQRTEFEYDDEDDNTSEEAKSKQTTDSEFKDEDA